MHEAIGAHGAVQGDLGINEEEAAQLQHEVAPMVAHEEDHAEDMD